MNLNKQDFDKSLSEWSDRDKELPDFMTKEYVEQKLKDGATKYKLFQVYRIEMLKQKKHPISSAWFYTKIHRLLGTTPVPKRG